MFQRLFLEFYEKDRLKNYILTNTIKYLESPDNPLRDYLVIYILNSPFLSLCYFSGIGNI
jgi:hypothetical protein